MQTKCFFACMLTGVLSFWGGIGYERMRADPPIVAQAQSASVPPQPVCEAPFATLMGKEYLTLRRTGATAAIVVMYDGIERGQLVWIDLDRHLVLTPEKRVFGWDFGSRCACGN